jgi:hypothetical protein
MQIAPHRPAPRQRDFKRLSVRPAAPQPIDGRISPSPKLTQWHWWRAGLPPSSVARRPRQPPNLMAEGREFASPIMGGAAGDTPRIRTTRTCARTSNPSTILGPISEQPSRPCGCDRPRAHGRTDDLNDQMPQRRKNSWGWCHPQMHRCGFGNFLLFSAF